MNVKNKSNTMNIDEAYKRIGALVLLVIVMMFGLTVMTQGSLVKEWEERQFAAASNALITDWNSQNNTLAQIKDVQIVAESAIVYDIVAAKELYSKNVNTQLPLASLTKLVTALLADKNATRSGLIQVTQDALSTEGNSGLIAGDVWRARDLSDYMLTVSSNDAATVFANQAGDREQFIIEMNNLAQQLGLQQTVFTNESGLDISEREASAYGSARDIAHLLTYITVVDPALIEATTFQSFTSVSSTGLRYKAINTNHAVSKIPNMIGGKTGFTDLAGGNLAVVFDAGIGRPIVVVVLGSTKEARFDDVLKLVSGVI